MDKGARKSRVQGGWNNRRVDSKKKASTTPLASPSENVFHQPVWTGNNVDISGSAIKKSSSAKFTQPEEEEVVKTDEVDVKLLTKPGVYDLGRTHQGFSRIRLFHNFVSSEESDMLFSLLVDQVPWEQKSVVKPGVRYLQPRLVAWYGASAYSFSGLHHPAQPEMIPQVDDLRQKLESLTGTRYNSVLCNMYRDHKDHVAWHSDDENLFGNNPTIASISLGDVRKFEMKPANAVEGSRYELYRIPLPHGSLLIMEGACQADWKHRVPTEYHDRGPRVNLTYREVVNPL